MDIGEIASSISGAVAQHQVEAAYLFGSYAAGTADKESDVDIAVLLAAELDAEARFARRLDLIAALERSLNRRADVLILNEIPSIALKFDIVAHGMLLFAQDDFRRAEYESRIMSEYFDFKPTIDQYNEAYVAANS